MATVYLHIGTMKTGTSALQSFLDENRELLEEQGYAYPRMKVGLPNNFIFRNAHFLVHSRDRTIETTVDEQEVMQKAYAQIEELAKKFDHIILSDEVIWHLSRFDADFWADMLENFKKINCEVKIIVYLRRQDMVAESLYNQNVKSNRMVSKRFIDYLGGNLVKTFLLNYYEQLKKIERYVKKENMFIRIYEKEQFEGEEHTIYSDFLNCIGLSFTNQYIIERPAANLGLQGNYIELKRIINGLPEYRELGDFMARPLRAASAVKNEGVLHGGETLFEPEEQAEFMAQFEEGNRKIAVEFLGREDGVLFKEPIGSLPTWTLDRDTLYQDILMSAAETFSYQEKKIRKMEEENRRSAERIQALEDRLQSLEEEIRAPEGLREQVTAMHKSLIFRGYRKARKAIGHN
ncbi:MAG: hypothetical protein NC300_11770 [Bacteroidales bacterium]|nr:hypothetical protein [Clostridium sp.]MCM1204810.1 hypothetical protein [Bacteroidales bacterium]